MRSRTRAAGALAPALLLLGGLLAAESCLRPRVGSNDTFHYLDVATNVAAGRGLTHHVPGYNQARFPAEPAFPAPFTAQPPLEPVAIALLVRLGAPPATAGLLISLAGFGLALAAGGALAGRLGGAQAADLFRAGLACASLVPLLAQRVWSEPLALGLMLSAFLLAARARTTAAAALAGVVAGLAGVTRWAILPAVPLLALSQLLPRALAARADGAPRKPEVGAGASDASGALRAAALFAGALLPVLPVLLRERALTGSWLGPARNPDPHAAGELLGPLARSFALDRAPVAWGALVLALIAAATLAGTRRGRALARAAFALEAVPLLAWCVGYALLVLALRARLAFDAVGFRLMLPALVPEAVPLAVILAGALAPVGVALRGALIVAVLACSAAVATRIARSAAPSDAQRVSWSPLATWLRDHPGAGDLVIAEDAVDMAWLLRDPRRGARPMVSFSPAPYMRPLERADLVTLVRRAREHDPSRPVWFALRRRERSPAEWRASYGGFVADLALRGADPQGMMVPVATLGDAWIFRVADGPP